MKTYTARTHTSRLAAFLCANHKPFTYDGYWIEFTATESFVEEMRAFDSVLAVINLKVR